MATYTATNNYSALDATQPTGSEDAGKIDDALRETRLVAKTTMMLAHSPIGEHAVALWADIQSGVGSYPAPSGVNAWHARVWQRLVNSGTIDQSTNPNVFEPIAGTYLVYADALGFQIQRHQIRLFNITDGIVVPNCFGTIAFSMDQVVVPPTNAVINGSATPSILWGTFVTDGTKSYRVEHMFSTNNTVNGWGFGTSAGMATAGATSRFANCVMLKLA